MQTAKPNTTYLDQAKHIKESVVTNADGWGEFRCNGRSVSVWMPEEKRSPKNKNSS